MRLSYLFAVAAVTLSGMGAVAGSAVAEPRVLGNHQDWSAFAAQEGSGQVCYIASRPKEERGDYTRRGEVYAVVTHRPASGARDVVSFQAGYTYRQGSEVEVDIDGRKFTLFTHEGMAWAPDETADRALVQAMAAGRQMVVRGTSSRGTLTTDTYSLSGFTRAHQEINRACGLTS